MINLLFLIIIMTYSPLLKSGWCTISAMVAVLIVLLVAMDGYSFQAGEWLAAGVMLTCEMSHMFAGNLNALSL